MMFSIADNIQNVRERIQKATIAAARPEDSVQLLAVTKTRPAIALREALESGLHCFGENYLNEALERQQALAEMCSSDQYQKLVWHFIGPIQSNKTKPIAQYFDWVHSVDREKVAIRLNDQRPDNMVPLNVCIQVNVNQEESKSGVLMADLNEFAGAISLLPRLKLRGLMCIPDAAQSELELRQSFLKMKKAYQHLQNSYADIDTLSMGMSGDIEIAIDCGSTLVRVGTALFGERAAKKG
jgi:pyridoxal phosphate enzyme (YggS family)